MSELCSFKCLKLHTLVFAIAHAQIKVGMLIKIGHNCVANIKHKKTDQSLEKSSEINFEFIKFVKKNENCLPSTKTNREY